MEMFASATCLFRLLKALVASMSTMASVLLPSKMYA